MNNNRSSYERLDPKAKFEVGILALTEFLLRATQNTPSLIVVDNASRLDEGSRAILETVAAKMDTLPLGMIVISRETWEELLPLNVPKHIKLKTLQLQGLKREEAKGLAEEILWEPVDNTLLRDLYRRTKGNPLFVIELVQHLKQINALDFSEQGWKLSKDAPELPSTTNILLTSRLDRLPRDLRRVVSIASIFGEEFSAEALRKMVKMADKHLELGEKLGLWVREKDTFKFINTLLRDVAYELQLSTEKQKLHLSAGKTLEELYGEDPYYYYQIGMHYIQGGAKGQSKKIP